MEPWENSGFCSHTISDYLALFKRLESPDSSAVNGAYLAQFIGPSWLKMIAPRLLPLGGLGGWAGKSFMENGTAINLVKKRGELQEKIPMLRQTFSSCVDGRSALVLSYDARAPLPLRCLVDELRSLDENTLLGITIVDLPVLRRFAMPFLLRRK